MGFPQVSHHELYNYKPILANTWYYIVLVPVLWSGGTSIGWIYNPSNGAFYMQAGILGLTINYFHPSFVLSFGLNPGTVLSDPVLFELRQ